MTPAFLARRRTSSGGLLACLLWASTFGFCLHADAQVPPRINHQGRVVVGAVNFDGTGLFRFALVNADGTVTYWSNDGTSIEGNEPAAAVSLEVAKGLYAVGLGDTSVPNMTEIPPAVFENADVWLRIWFDDGQNGSQQLAPDQRISAAGYAMVSASVADGAITSAKIAPDAIGPANISAGAIGNDQIAPGVIAPDRLAVSGAANPGTVLSFDGTGFAWTPPGGAFAQSNGAAYYNEGAVGIGTSTPGTKLQVKTGGGDYGVSHTDGVRTLGTYIGGSSSGATGGWFGTLTNHPLHLFVNNGQPLVTLGTSGFVGIGTANPGARLHVAGGVIYDGLLSKLDISEVFASTIRSADLFFGHSSRRGTPGRALVDQGSALAVNFAGDWATTILGGNVAIGTATPAAKFHSVANAVDDGTPGGRGTAGYFEGDLVTSQLLSATYVRATNNTNGFATIFARKDSSTGYAGFFQGNLHTTATLTKAGGSFKIDHPLDPANKYLSHSFVESPDMMNIYNGNIVLDANGEATVQLPAWFEALNKEFRYQLTAIGAPGPGLYIAEEISGNQFKIAGGRPAMKVSWHVTGVRQDAWANARRIPVEEDKPKEERGAYLHPELFGEPAESQIGATERAPVADADRE